MKTINYATSGTCSRLIHLELDDNNVITACHFIGGCNGNLQGIASLVKGKKADEIIPLVENISCNGRPTSCPDQLAKALRKALEE